MDDLYKLEVLSLVDRITQEIVNHTGKHCPILALSQVDHGIFQA